MAAGFAVSPRLGDQLDRWRPLLCITWLIGFLTDQGRFSGFAPVAGFLDREMK
jgi:hypothetical protein